MSTTTIDTEKQLWRIAESGIHNRGLFAATDIKAGTEVIEYIGEKITKDESERRACQQMEVAGENGDGAVYIFAINKRYDIDGNVAFNHARLINHSCDPNCETDIYDGHVWIIAIRDIKEGEELSYNYNFDLDNYEEHPCLCGTKRCLGYIVGDEYRKELRKKLGKTKKTKKAEKKVAAGV